jgi:DHA1 family multidrug resistance protein-like MFS transporter
MDKPAQQVNPTISTLQTSIFLLSQPFFIMGLILPLQSKGIGASALQIGFIFSVFSVMTILLRPLIGWALDRFGRRLFYVAGTLVYMLAMVSFAYSQHVAGMVIARLLQGAASALVWLSASAMIADVSGESNRATTFGGLTQASTRGSILGAFIAFTLYNSSFVQNLVQGIDSWTLLFLVFALFAAVAFFVALIRLPETKPHPGHNIPFTPIVWSRTWILLLLVTLVTAAAWSMTSPILILFLQDRLHAGVNQIAWAFFPSGLVWALLPAHLGRLADRFGRKPLMVLGLMASAVTMFLLPSLTTTVGLAVLWALLALCFAAGDPAEQALIADLTDRNQRGRAYGLYVMFADIGAAIGPLSGGWLYQTINPASPFYTNGVILFLCSLVLLIFLQIPKNSLVDVAEA